MLLLCFFAALVAQFGHVFSAPLRLDIGLKSAKVHVSVLPFVRTTSISVAHCAFIFCHSHLAPVVFFCTLPLSNLLSPVAGIRMSLHFVLAEYFSVFCGERGWGGGLLHCLARWK